MYLNWRCGPPENIRGDLPSSIVTAHAHIAHSSWPPPPPPRWAASPACCTWPVAGPWTGHWASWGSPTATPWSCATPASSASYCPRTKSSPPARRCGPSIWRSLGKSLKNLCLEYWIMKIVVRLSSVQYRKLIETLRGWYCLSRKVAGDDSILLLWCVVTSASFKKIPRQRHTDKIKPK